MLGAASGPEQGGKLVMGAAVLDERARKIRISGGISIRTFSKSNSDTLPEDGGVGRNIGCMCGPLISSLYWISKGYM